MEVQFTITNSITQSLAAIERARGFLAAATLSSDWVQEMQSRALLWKVLHIKSSIA